MQNNEIKKILEDNKTIAVVGCSSNPAKPSHYVPNYMKEHGYRIIPVNPNSDEILGEKSFKSLSEIKEKIDVVNIFRPREECLDIVKEAVKLKPKVIWMQQGIVSQEAKELAEKIGIRVVMDKCMMAEHRNQARK